jgi:adenylate kinase family enzyme
VPAAPLRPEPVLIGPAFAGKTTIGEALAHRLGLGFVDLEGVGDEYYGAAGMPTSGLRAQIHRLGHSEAHRWWQPARVAGVEGVLADHVGCVVALGAGHTHYEERIYFEMVREALAPFENVVLLLPSQDLDKSVEVLWHRARSDDGDGWDHDGRDWLREWCESDQNLALATRTVYTQGRSTAETADHIARLVEADLA